MAISSPNVIPANQQNQNQIVQAAGVAQRGVSDLMSRMEQQRQFDQNTQFQIMQMDPDQRTMFATQNPEAFANILKGIRGVSSDDAWNIVESYASDQLSHRQQAENAMANIMEAGGYGGGQAPPQPRPQPNPQPQPQPQPGPRENVPFQQGIESPIPGARWGVSAQEQQQQPGRTGGNSVAGGPVSDQSYQELQGMAQRARGGEQSAPAQMPQRGFDPNAPQNQGITGMNAAGMQELAQENRQGRGVPQGPSLQGGEVTVQQLYDLEGAGGLIQSVITRSAFPEEKLGENVVTLRDMLNEGSRDINWGEFNKVVPNPDKDTVALETGEEIPLQDWLEQRNMSMEDLQRTRAALETSLKGMFGEEGSISYEEIRENPEQYFQWNPQSPERSWMWHQGLSGDEVREIQRSTEDPMEMYTQARNIVNKKEQERYEQLQQETVGENPPPKTERQWQSAQNLTYTMNRGQEAEFNRRANNATSEVMTRENGTIRLRDDLSEQDIRQYTQRAAQTNRYLADRAMPRNEEEMRERGTATLKNSQAKLELLTGETGQDAFTAARNYLNEDSYLEERIALVENELELQRWATEKEISIQEAQAVLRERIFEAEQEAAVTAGSIQNPDDARKFVGEQRKALYEYLGQVEGEVNADKMAKLYNEDVMFRSAWDTYMTSLATYYQVSGIPIEINTHSTTYNRRLRNLFSGKEAEIPYIGSPMGGEGQTGGETQSAYQNLPASDRAIIEEFTGQAR